jgi:hypothetical protein
LQYNGLIGEFEDSVNLLFNDEKSCAGSVYLSKPFVHRVHSDRRQSEREFVSDQKLGRNDQNAGQ